MRCKGQTNNPSNDGVPMTSSTGRFIQEGSGLHVVEPKNTQNKIITSVVMEILVSKQTYRKHKLLRQPQLRLELSAML